MPTRVAGNWLSLTCASGDKFGRRKYGTPLQPFNGRDPLVDAYQEVLDLAVYLRQAIWEREVRAEGRGDK